MAQTQTLLAAHGVSVGFRGRTILDNVDVAVERGEIVTIIGLNGAGKSTLVRVLLGLIRPDAGRVWRREGLRVGYSPQHIQRDPALPLSVSRFLSLGTGVAARDPRLAERLAEVGAEHVLASQLAEISGGELHRVLLARALLRAPDLLVLDEPLAGVDVAGQSELYRLIGELRDRYGCGVLLVSHDLHVVMAATDRVLCINHHVCCTGRPESVSRHPEFVALFGAHVAQALALYTHDHDHTHDAAGMPIPTAPDPPAEPANRPQSTTGSEPP
ncbi:MAG: metal ABC transporter ATP-binding protein [Gammaproteobacteria bacterium]|nr:metal ABC transporter ATP-binding protein [Gammaproteobacteria bacterium]